MDTGHASLRTGMQMRVDAALGVTLPPDLPPPEGEWVRRYRLMHADEPTD